MTCVLSDVFKTFPQSRATVPLYTLYHWPVTFTKSALLHSAYHTVQWNQKLWKLLFSCSILILGKLTNLEYEKLRSNFIFRVLRGWNPKTRGKNYPRMETRCLSIQHPNVLLKPKIIIRNFPTE